MQLTVTLTECHAHHAGNPVVISDPLAAGADRRPGGPRFQAFSVGFGEDFDEAETQATMISQRFSSQNEGSGCEVMTADFILQRGREHNA